MNSSPWRYDLAPEDREEEDGEEEEASPLVAALAVSRAAESQAAESQVRVAVAIVAAPADVALAAAVRLPSVLSRRGSRSSTSMSRCAEARA